MKVHWRKAEVQGGSGFSLTEPGCFSLARLLLSKEKFFPGDSPVVALPAWGCKVFFFLWAMQLTLSSRA